MSQIWQVLVSKQVTVIYERAQWSAEAEAQEEKG